MPVDLPEDAAVALSYQVLDFHDLQARAGGFSETFTLPYTARNARLLELAHSLDSDTRRPYVRLPAQLYSNGLLVLSGTGLLDSSGQSGYELLLVSDTGALFAAVEGQPLSALDLSAFDHVLTPAAVQAGQLYGGAYTYPLVNDGRLTSRYTADPLLPSVHYTELSPAVFTAPVLSAIVAAALPGFALTGTLLADETFQRHQLLAGAVGPRRRQAYIDAHTATARTTQAIEMSGVPRGSQLRGIVFAAASDPGSHLTAGAYFEYPTLAYTALPERDEYTLTVEGELEFSNIDTRASGLNGAALLLWVNLPDRPFFVTERLFYQGAAVSGRTRIKASVTIPNTGGENFTLILNLLNQGTVRLLPGAAFTITPGPRAYENSPVHLDANLPDWSQSDLLLLLANQFGAVFQVDPASETVRVDRLADLPAAVPLDLTDKLDFSQRPRIRYRLGSTARQNEWRYADAPAAYELLADADYTGAGQLLCPDETLEAHADAYVAPGPALRSGPAVTGAAALPWLPRFTQKEGSAFEIYTSGHRVGSGTYVYKAGRFWKSKQETSTIPSFDQLDKWEPVAEADVFSGGGKGESVCALFAPLTEAQAGGVLIGAESDPAPFRPTAGLTFEGLDYAADLLPAYFAPVAEALSRVAVLEVGMRLNAADIYALDFTRPIVLSVAHWPGYGPLSGSFWLNLIDQYQPGSTAPVRCELVSLNRLVGTVAPPPVPAGIFDYTFDSAFE
ncbi:hypothetical protein [Hymenobacter lapidiphilus]|uniref:Uncharacterized protein n=1 Tax=Hymenobacter lapidiphilus TaxID=2608003 RepID=A0A7Y7U7C3_9BACT|nr:hypothetical protein [Hymenobacter lapidiphilus]NVO33267.1 hypothetical protein [Hymenobacter lapidiphilus]